MEQNQRKYKYHFTSCTSLHGMLKDYSMNNPYLTMWATHSSFMNDSSEYEYGRKKCMEVLRLYEKKANIPPEKSIFKRSRKQLEEFMTKDAPFLISLSSNIESAAMWGMYSSNGNGIALEFDATILRKEGLLKGDNSVEPEDCIYFRSTSDVLNEYWEYIKATHDALSYFSNEEDGNIQNILLLDIASQIKHRSFDYEGECRIVVPKGNDTKFRVRDNAIIPYIEVKVPIEALTGVIVGPTANFEYIRKSIEMFIESRDLGPLMQPLSIKIKKSEVPYRG